MSIYLKNATYYDWRSGAFYQGSFQIDQDSEIQENGEAKGQSGIHLLEGDIPEAGSGARIIDCQHKLVMDSFVLSHHHIYSAMARGMPAPPRPPENFSDILKLVWWRLDKRLDLDMIRASAMAVAMDSIRCGVTSIIDHHASPNAVNGSLETIASALEESGLTHLLCYELSDRDGRKSRDAALEETRSYLASGQPGMVGMHASFTVSGELLNSAVQLAGEFDTGIHVHLAEGEIDQTHCQEHYGKRVMQRFADAGLLELPGNLFVHGLHLDENEKQLIRDSRSFVVHNPESNLNNNVGHFQWEGWPPEKVLIGTDGMHSDVVRSARAAFFLAQSTGGMGHAGLPALLDNGKSYLEKFHPRVLRANDFVIFDYDPPTPFVEDNVMGHFLFGLDARHVDTVIAGGRIILEKGEFTDFDEAETNAFCREQALRLWKELKS